MAETYLQWLPRRDFSFKYAPTDVRTHACNDAKAEGLHVAFADILALSPVFDGSNEHNTTPHVCQEQALLLAIVLACYVILVHTESLLCVQKMRGS